MGNELLFEGMDRVLLLLANAVNKGIPEVGITLNVGGLIISGTMISNKKYWDETQPAFRDMLKESGEELDKPDEMGYIHLRDAMFINAGEDPVPTSGMWWRGKIKSVDGFSLMLLKVKDEGQK